MSIQTYAINSGMITGPTLAQPWHNFWSQLQYKRHKRRKIPILEYAINSGIIAGPTPIQELRRNNTSFGIIAGPMSV